MTKKLLMGNEAFAHAALEAGVRVVAGYPGTPSSELIETVAKLHADGAARGIHVEWSTNEKSALELLAGASYTGARCLFTCKQVGLNVASDALMSLNYVGVKGGMVLFVADDPGPISSQTEQDTRRFASFAKLPVLDPATPDQGFDMMHGKVFLTARGNFTFSRNKLLDNDEPDWEYILIAASKRSFSSEHGGSSFWIS